jgi:alpha-glucosidase
MPDNPTDLTRRTLIGGMGLAALAPPVAAQGREAVAQTLLVTSPDGRLSARLHLPDGGAGFLQWSAQDGDQVLIYPSRLSLVLRDGHLLGPRARFLGHEVTAMDRSWAPPYGISARYDGRANQLEARFEDRHTGIRFAIRLLAQDGGLAFRFVLLAARDADIWLGGEDCAFTFPEGTNVWSSRDEGTYAQSAPGDLNPVPDPPLTDSTDKGALADIPLLAVLPSGSCLLLGESDRLHYPRLMLRGGGTHAVATQLMRFPGRATGYSGPGTTPAQAYFSVKAPFATPWRVLAVARDPAQLVERASLVPTLATPDRLGDSTWIRPGRAFRIRKPYTNARAQEAIAFAVRRKLDFIEFDAQWYGDGTDPSDATHPIDGLDMAGIIAAARAKGLGTILYVDRVPVMRQRDAILQTYRAWGVAGVKFGFVWDGRQSDTDFIEALVKDCGEHRLMVNLHDNLRPAGMERTYPNYLALEGVRGNEHFPTAGHNVTLPFIRNVAGPADYTICYNHYLNHTTNAHQLAMAVVYYSPLTFLYWYDEASQYAHGAWEALSWFDECPTSWDETRALSGAVGDHVVVARRKGARWFLGAMCNEVGRNLSIPLTFLGEGPWSARRYMDGAPTDAAWKTPVLLNEQTVTARERLDLVLAPSGGQTVIFSALHPHKPPERS